MGQVVDLAEAKGTFLPALEGKRVRRYLCEPPEIAVRLDSKKPIHNTGSDKRFVAAAFLIRQTASFPIVGPHEHATHFRNSLHALFAPTDGIDVKYLVALLNSKVLRFVYTETVRESQQKAFPQVKLAALRGLPMRKIDLTNSSDRASHDALVRLVDDALANQKRLVSEKNPLRKDALQRQFETIDAEIEARVYTLYGLTQVETAFIEDTLVTLSEPEKPSSWRPTPASPVLNPSRTAKPVGGPRSTRPHSAAKVKKSSSRN